MYYFVQCSYSNGGFWYKEPFKYTRFTQSLATPKRKHLDISLRDISLLTLYG